MGQTLSEPVVEKHSDQGQDDQVSYGLSSMQGWRISMEDAHACILDLKSKDAESSDEPTPRDRRVSFFGVYDGHGGDKVAIYTGERLHNIVAEQKSFKEGNFEQALKDGFLAIDRAILADPTYKDEVSGCTASVGLIHGNKLYVANAGDSRTVLGRLGRAKPLSFDHKPTNEGEKMRIENAGGFVDFGRVNGNLALSRAIGDFEFKKNAEMSPEKQIVTAFPDVTIHAINGPDEDAEKKNTDAAKANEEKDLKNAEKFPGDDEFVVIACDGIWDCQSSQAVVQFVRRGIAARQPLSKICENMMDNCLASNSDNGGVGCDNMTMIVVALLQEYETEKEGEGGKKTKVKVSQTLDEWYDMVAKRVSLGAGPCAPPEYAQFRGPGVHHRFDDGPDDLDMGLEHRGRGGMSSRVILLGDGTELTSEDSEDYQYPDEDEDLENQLSRNKSPHQPTSITALQESPAPITTESPSSTKTDSSDDVAATPQSNTRPAVDTPSSSSAEPVQDGSTK